MLQHNMMQKKKNSSHVELSSANFYPTFQIGKGAYSFLILCMCMCMYPFSGVKEKL
jgi:hypothetical protein